MLTCVGVGVCSPMCGCSEYNTALALAQREVESGAVVTVEIDKLFNQLAIAHERAGDGAAAVACYVRSCHGLACLLACVLVVFACCVLPTPRRRHD